MSPPMDRSLRSPIESVSWQVPLLGDPPALSGELERIAGCDSPAWDNGDTGTEAC